MMPLSLSNTAPVSLPISIDFSNGWPNQTPSAERSVYESESARLLLQHNALDRLDRLFATQDQCIHQHKGRAVCQVNLYQPGGESLPAFIKLNWGRRRIVPRFSDIKTGQAYQCLPTREWDGIELFKAQGLLVPERLALIKQGRVWFQEAVVMKRVRPQFSLDEMINNQQWHQLSQDDQAGLLEGVVEVMQRIHQAGLGWRGTCTRHFFPEKTSQGRWQFWLIDCEGVHRHLTRKAIVRDYRKLNRALAISGAEESTLQFFQRLTDRAQTILTARKSFAFLNGLSWKFPAALKPAP